MSERQLTVVHFIDEFSQPNHGILEASLGTARILAQKHNIDSEIWFPKPSPDQQQHLSNFDFRESTPVSLENTQNGYEIFSKKNFTACNCVVISHGSWGSPTKLGRKISGLEIPWIYTPHGMLEPWSMEQKKWKKLIYWKLFEKPMVNKASLVRATSIPEEINLRKFFENVELHTHGVQVPQSNPKTFEKIRFLFMGRLHSKKGPTNLVKAWINSSLNANPNYELNIVGNDDGELQSIKKLINQTKDNIIVNPPKFGREKEALFSNSHFFVLPSHSEGFPMALLEGMAGGLIPIISEGCNLPKAFDLGLAIKVSPSVENIKQGLEKAAKFTTSQLNEKHTETTNFVKEHFSLESIAHSQATLYRSLLNEKGSAPS